DAAGDSPAQADARAGDARRARPADCRVVGSAPDTRRGGRARPPRRARRPARRAHRRHCGHVAGLVRVSRPAPARRLDGTAGRLSRPRRLRPRRRRPARPAGHPLRLMLRLVLIGTSHHHAPVELREQVALGREEAEELASRLAGDEREAACLSTYNRTELYVASADAEQAERDAVQALASLSPEVEPALDRKST